MATVAATYTPDPRLPLRGLLFAALLAIGIMFGVHSVNKHGADAEAIHRCLENSGPEMVWNFTSAKRANEKIYACRLPDGRWGITILQKFNRCKIPIIGFLCREKTSFVVGDGSWAETWNYLLPKGVRPSVPW